MKIFAPALKRQMKDCILAVLWPKKDIYKFFRDCSVPDSALKSIVDWDNKSLARSSMVDQVFDALSRQPDNGTMHFNLMLDELSTWSHFDDFWFKNQQKLDLDDAKTKIAALLSAKSKHVDTAKKRAEELRSKEAAREERHKSMEDM